jgi:sugar (pentulose or hexulose) kinase
MSKNLKILAFDFGASSGRGMLGTYDGEKLTLEEKHRFSNDPVNVRGSLYWDVLRLFHEIKQGILQCANGGDKDFASIGIDTWGVDYGLLDRKGNLIGNPYNYRDTRTEGMMEEAFSIAGKEEIFNQTGIQFMNFNTIFQLKFFYYVLIGQRMFGIGIVPQNLQYAKRVCFFTANKRHESTPSLIY